MRVCSFIVVSVFKRKNCVREKDGEFVCVSQFNRDSGWIRSSSQSPLGFPREVDNEFLSSNQLLSEWSHFSSNTKKSCWRKKKKKKELFLFSCCTLIYEMVSVVHIRWLLPKRWGESLRALINIGCTVTRVLRLTKSFV